MRQLPASKRNLFGTTIDSTVVVDVVDVVLGGPEGWYAGGAILAILTVLWAVLPRLADRVDDTPRNPPPGTDGSATSS